MNAPTRSGEGWRMTLAAEGEPVVSIWAYTERDAEYMAHEGNLRYYEAMEEQEARVAREAEEQAWVEHRKIRARA